MNECKWNIPEYLNGSMEAKERKAFEAHLSECTVCQEEVEEWSLIAGGVQEQNEIPVASRDLFKAALQQAQTKTNSRWNLNYALTMIRAQVPLIRSELWASSFLILMLGIIASLMLDHIGPFRVIAPMVAAGCVAAVYGKNNDDAFELTLSTPVSQMQVLLSRLVLVFGYNLMLFLIAVAILRPLQENLLTMSLLGEWLAPMMFLSSLALLLSVSFGASLAVMVTYILWLTSLVMQVSTITPIQTQMFASLALFWQQTGVLYGLSLGLLALTMFALRLPIGKSARNIV